MAETPKNLGYRYPAEWEKHKSVWLAWPYDRVSFPGGILDKVEDQYLKIINIIKESEKVELIVNGDAMKERVLKKLSGESGLDNVNIHITDYGDVWFRDFGPSFLINDKTGALAMVDWTYNAYGNKWQELLKDDEVPAWMNEFLGLAYFKPGIILEGGAVESNGLGALLTTEQCLLNKNRNADLSKIEIEKYLSDYLGAKNVIWLKNGLAKDHTDGHIDNIARFVNKNTILYAWEEPGGVNYEALNENLEILKKAKDQEGREFELIAQPLPKLTDKTGEILAVSYANFYIGNEAVLVPVFGHENDEKALAIIKSVFPERKIIGINSADLVYGGGALHCISREQPAINK